MYACDALPPLLHVLPRRWRGERLLPAGSGSGSSLAHQTRPVHQHRRPAAGGLAAPRVSGSRWQAACAELCELGSLLPCAIRATARPALTLDTAGRMRSHTQARTFFYIISLLWTFTGVSFGSAETANGSLLCFSESMRPTGCLGVVAQCEVVRTSTAFVHHANRTAAARGCRRTVLASGAICHLYRTASGLLMCWLSHEVGSALAVFLHRWWYGLPISTAHSYE